MSSISPSTVVCNSTTFQPQRSLSGTRTVLVPDEDLRGRNAVLLQSTVLGETLDITNDIRIRSHERLLLSRALYLEYMYVHAYNT